MAVIMLYTDGSCPRNPGPGGWAFCVVVNGVIRHTASGHEYDSTNNRMEMIAVMRGLEWLIRNYDEGTIRVVSDSQYVINGLKDWCHKWRRSKWMRRDKDGRHVKIKNADLWPALFGLAHVTLRCEFVWQRGHKGEQFNELCDKMAGEAAWRLIESQ
jgi:ribonuclease HI